MISYSAITDYQSLGRKSLPPAVKLVWDIRHIDRRGMRGAVSITIGALLGGAG